MRKINFLIIPSYQKACLKFFFLLCGAIMVTSCASKEEIVYFEGIERLQNAEAPDHVPTEIEVNDILRIDVSSINDEIVEPFVMDFGSGAGGGGNRNGGGIQGYLVDTEGNITFPVLGEVPVLGKTREELEVYLREALETYVRDAVVRVRIVNYKVTVIGETGSSVIEVPDERLSIIQALAMAGDISYDGKRENVLVVRMQDGVMKVGRIDMTSANVFESPFYYLRQNDIVYVEPTYRKVKSAGFITSWQGLVSIVTTAFSVFVLLNNI